MKLKEAVKQINPLEYANLLKKIELLDCYLKQVNYECPSRKTDGQAT